ncbi:hydrolethalus syndrome protein 1 homolog isoform X2 [Melanotaenia boesemani]|uniref:hydrolethalus syndrome protein 1 homolog isoform X2 n=1 Tax=Melanotaenia boesemani TaxID=1250792 RepID=UPI001C04DA04|nr:hydrolethalus syndrome protein 1 homolog isoform X2 [Melanotaenia boesemani]
MDILDNLAFSEEEIQEQLSVLGYKNIPKHRLLEFKQDLDALIGCEEWKSMMIATQDNTKSQTGSSQPNPPPYTTEKVIHVKDSSKRISLHAGKRNDGRQPASTHEDRTIRRQQERCDSYAKHSVALKIQLPPGSHGRPQVEADLEETLSDSVTPPPDTPKRCLIKRKVLRKHEGQSVVCDESFYSEDSETASHLDERLAEFRLSTSAQRDFEEEDEAISAHGSETDAVSLSAFESYMRGMTRSQNDGDLRPKSKSFIRPAMRQQTIKKTDTVARYFQYKQIWEKFKPPGEKDRRALRSEIKARKHICLSDRAGV